MNLHKLKFYILLCVVFQCQLQAAVVTQSKNGKVRIDNEKDEIETGQEYYLLNLNKKKIAVVRISTVKNEESIALVIQGKSDGTESLLFKSEATGTDKVPRFTKNTTNVETKPTTTYRLSQRKISVLLNLMSSQISALEADAQAPTPNVEDVKMTGSSIGLTAAYDQPINSWFEFRATLGFEPLTVAGTASINGCDSATSRDCNAHISYLSLGGYARFNLYKARTLVWVGFGTLGKFPIAKKSTALRTEDLQLAGAYGVTAGIEYFLNNKIFIPFSIEQQYFISTETVKASQLSIRTGLGIAY